MWVLLFYILMTIATYFYIALQWQTMKNLVRLANDTDSLNEWGLQQKPHLFYTNKLMTKYNLSVGEWSTIWPIYWIALVANDLTHAFSEHESVLLETWAQSRADRYYKKFKLESPTEQSERHP